MSRRIVLGDEGYATVTSAGIVAAVASLCVVVAALGAHVANDHRAQVAADLAAVAGAEAHYRGGEACRAARDTALLNSATAQSCDVVGGDVIVSVSVGAASARARAGPL
ncbi:Rv3654c family TadE-like protein [Corynebacterium qintianiae]|uniref:Rv3654c family TadE-like protein n=1 Tax=Corynebacterium qintianiae TaxID=2709392 RepID=UPI0013E99F70|nr:Rv3654c family TadE-like protein [Corynebacterium qintianiae]